MGRTDELRRAELAAQRKAEWELKLVRIRQNNMTTMIIDLQLATQETDGLPSAEQIEQWATAAVRSATRGCGNDCADRG